MYQHTHNKSPRGRLEKGQKKEKKKGGKRLKTKT